MKLLLDTHVAIWWEANHPKLSQRARDLISNASDDVLVSRCSLWEMAVKVNLGRLKMDLGRFVQRIELTGFQWLGIETDHILAYVSLPTFSDHEDPFDRLLVAQSLTEPLILVTADAHLARYGSTVRVVASGTGQPDFDMGEALVDLTKASPLTDELEDAETVAKIRRRRRRR